MKRRRFLKILGASSLATVFPLSHVLSDEHLVKSSMHRFSAEVMNGLAGFTIVLDNREQAREIAQLCFDEIKRLESIFSLFLPGSSIRKLNETGILDNPPIELVAVLEEARKLSELSSGVFDVTLQPLWKYLFYLQDSSPDLKKLENIKRLVDYRAVNISSRRISFEKSGMEITLNGIAQGYITDKVTELLRANGMKQVLVELGETYALGRPNDFDLWKIGIINPEGEGFLKTLNLENQALATSGGYGTRFGSDQFKHHLINPKTVSSANYFKSLSVIASNATHADGLSTTLSLLEAKAHHEILAHYQGAKTLIY